MQSKRATDVKKTAEAFEKYKQEARFLLAPQASDRHDARAGGLNRRLCGFLPDFEELYQFFENI